MTDKQIIIDDQKKTIHRLQDECTEKTSVIIALGEQLKRAEQECEELKKIIDEAKNSKLDLKSFLVGEAIQNEYEQQLDQLKANNEELKKIIERLDVPKHEVIDMDIALENEKLKKEINSLLCSDNCYRNKKLKQTLTEIKEIAEWKNEYWSLGIDDYKNMVDEILQTISECEATNER